MRIAVISDTHDRVPADLCTRLATADEVWHLGDVCRADVLEYLRSECPPLKVVMGNCDAEPWPLTLNLTREGARFHLVHIPPRSFPRDSDFLLHGHTHVPRDETIRGVRWLNPGCVSHANRGAPASFGWLAHDGKEWSWRIELL